MGASLRLKHVSPASFEALRQFAELMEGFVCAGLGPPRAGTQLATDEERATVEREMPDIFRRASGNDQLIAAAGMMLRTAARTALPLLKPTISALLAEWVSPALDLEKRWRRLVFVLTRTDEAGARLAQLLINGGESVGSDLGYGPARLLGEDQTRAAAEALQRISTDDVAGNFAPDRAPLIVALELSEPQLTSVWLRDDLSAMLEDYGRVQKYFQQAGQARRAMLLYFA